MLAPTKYVIEPLNLLVFQKRRGAWEMELNPAPLISTKGILILLSFTGHVIGYK